MKLPLKFYLTRDSYSSQVEGWSLLGFRFGYTGFGLAFWPAKWHQRPKWFPHFNLAVWNHRGQCDQRWVFRLDLFSHRFGYVTRGDATPDLASYRDAGWVVR